jgi:hypothetical protein
VGVAGLCDVARKPECRFEYDRISDSFLLEEEAYGSERCDALKSLLKGLPPEGDRVLARTIQRRMGDVLQVLEAELRKELPSEVREAKAKGLKRAREVHELAGKAK